MASLANTREIHTIPFHLTVARIRRVRAIGWCSCHGYSNAAKLLLNVVMVGDEETEEGTSADGCPVLPLSPRCKDPLMMEIGF